MVVAIGQMMKNIIARRFAKVIMTVHEALANNGYVKMPALEEAFGHGTDADEGDQQIPTVARQNGGSEEPARDQKDQEDQETK